MFAHSQNIAITGGNFAASVGSSAFKELQKACAPSAFHNSSAHFDPPKCHPNTRVAVLEYLMGWIFGHNDREALILWLYGPAGAGKSAILQTIAEQCFEHKLLLASFFFGRSDPMRNTFKALPYLESVIERDPLIFDKSIATQLHRLEQHLTLTFNSSPLAGLWRSLVLDDSFKPDDDIRLFLKDSFQEIQATHPTLIQKSSGQFIYASVVVKYVSAPIDCPHRRLEVIMGLRPTRHIVLSILGLVITGFVSMDRADCIEFLLDLEPGDVEIALSPLASICHLPENIDLMFTLGAIYIDTLIVQENLVSKSLAKLMDPSSFYIHPSAWLVKLLVELIRESCLGYR
ncbi:hypothetical protein BJ912DRAFT_1003085 [Pholiota molesta]|nr:hypothetical protein BJ912DRAFT_1003085 [Pholiota molesta]